MEGEIERMAPADPRALPSGKEGAEPPKDAVKDTIVDAVPAGAGSISREEEDNRR